MANSSSSKSSDSPTALARLRSYGYFLVAVFVYFFLLAAAQGVSAPIHQTNLQYLVSRSVLLLLQLAVFAGMGYAFQSQRNPIASMGLQIRKGMVREFFLGLAIGWGMILVCILPMSLYGGIVFSVHLTPRFWLISIVNMVLLLVAALQEETAFRGYPFQRLVDAINPVGAAIVMALIFGLAHIRNPGATTTSFLVTCLSALIFAAAYLRTRALWMAWGLHFGWNATLGLLFGLPVSGMTVFSSVVGGEAMGPVWLTGGNYGVEGSWLGVVVMIGGLIVVLMATRELNFKYNAPVILAAGIPVDLDAAAREQHAAAMGEPAPRPLVQIQPATAANSAPLSPINDSNSKSE
jgi:hypothetical protein